MTSVTADSSRPLGRAASAILRVGVTPIQIPLIGATASPLGAYQLGAGLVLAAFWLRSGLAHLGNPYYFLSSIYMYEIVGPSVGPLVAMVVPVLQLVLAVCLVARQFVGGALFASSALLALFASVQGSAWARGLQIGCGCFGAVEQREVGGATLRTVTLLLALAITAFLCWVGTADPSRQPLRAPEAE